MCLNAWATGSCTLRRRGLVGGGGWGGVEWGGVGVSDMLKLHPMWQ